MKKILLLTDFSEASQNALNFTHSLFRDITSHFHLLYPYSTGDEGSLTPINATGRLTYPAQLQDTVVGKGTDTRHTFHTPGLGGQPVDLIKQSIAEESYDVVVIGPTENSTDTVFGHNAIELVRKLKANILVVPAHAQPKPIEQIVLAIDFATLTNYQLLDPVLELVQHKSATLILLTVDTPGKRVIHVEQESHIRQYLSPIEPTIAREKAPSAKEGIDAYLATHQVDLLVTMPRYSNRSKSSTDGNPLPLLAKAFSPAVPLLTLYDEREPPRLIEDLSNLDFAL